MKTIGVLGGIGPQATMDFEQRIHRVAQQRIPQQANSGYPPMIVFFLRHPPILVDEEKKPLQPLQPDPRLLTAVRQLGAMADFLVIPSNTPHALQAEIEAAAGCPIVSMVAVTLTEVTRRGWRTVGLLGLGRPRVYLQPLADRGATVVTLGSDLRNRLDAAIFALMAGQESDEHRATAQEAIAYLRETGVDGIILGCTEIPLLLGDQFDAPDLINPAQLLAEAAVDAALA